jgi:hypothetical protein
MTATVATTSNAPRGAAMFVSSIFGEFLPPDAHCLCISVPSPCLLVLSSRDLMGSGFPVSRRSECELPCVFSSDHPLVCNCAHWPSLTEYGATKHVSRWFQVQSLMAVAAPNAQTRPALLDYPLSIVEYRFEKNRFLSLFLWKYVLLQFIVCLCKEKHWRLQHSCRSK